MPETRTRPRQIGRGQAAIRSLAAALFFVASLIHFQQIPNHFDEDALYGLFFLVAAVCQLVAGLLVLRPRHRRLYQLMIAGSLALVAVWVYTRTLGIPIGAEAGVRERIGLPDLIATGSELATVVSIYFLMARSASRRFVQTRYRRETGRSPMRGIPH